MIGNIRNIFAIPELKRRLLYTAAILAIYRLGAHIPTAGINGAALSSFMASQAGTLFGLYDLFAGGNFAKATIFALGIMPYISASIIFQLLAAVVPYFEKLQKEGEEGRKKINQMTRYGTVILAIIQSWGVSIFLESMNSGGSMVVMNPGLGFKTLTTLTMTAGTIFVMWLGEQITERGIGNGISLIIFIGIVARYPGDIFDTIRSLSVGSVTVINFIIFLLVAVGTIAGIIYITQGQRRIPVQYAKKVVGRKVYGGQSTHIPLRVNTAGVIPIIFAQAIMMIPSTLATFLAKSDTLQNFASILSPRGFWYNVIYAVIIIFFTYFYTSIVFNPVDLAENMKKYGGFIPGIRPGKRTAEYIDRILTRITFPGGIFLAAISVLPTILYQQLKVPFYFGGTSTLIVVGVALDTLQQIESHLLMRHYDGFLKKGKLRGRR
jgi:preprotein translocase subunit SecY